MLPGLLCSLTFTSNSCLEKSSQAEGIHVPVWVEGGKHCLAQRRWLPLGWAFSACREPFIQHTASKSPVSRLLMGGARLPGSHSLHRWGSQMIQTKEIRIMTSGDRWQTAAASCQAHKQHQHASWNKGSPVNLINWTDSPPISIESNFPYTQNLAGRPPLGAEVLHVGWQGLWWKTYNSGSCNMLC